MQRRVSATEARIHFNELMQQVEENEEPVIVEHNGKPRVMVISVATYERLVATRAQKGDWRALVAQTRAQVQMDLKGQKLTPPEVILREIREARDEQLVDLY